MPSPIFVPSRRLFLGSAAFTAAMFTVRGAFADQLVKTPKQTEGPSYPNKLPLDTDNDLIIVNDRLTPAVGEITYLSGRVLDPTGSPVRNAVVEIWQCDAKGVYIAQGNWSAAADNLRQTPVAISAYERLLKFKLDPTTAAQIKARIKTLQGSGGG